MSFHNNFFSSFTDDHYLTLNKLNYINSCFHTVFPPIFLQIVTKRCHLCVEPP